MPFFLPFLVFRVSPSLSLPLYLFVDTAVLGDDDGSGGPARGGGDEIDADAD